MEWRKYVDLFTHYLTTLNQLQRLLASSYI